MPRDGLGQPVTQVRLTNVAVVRLKKKGQRFEVACYRNKIVNWRNKFETDLSEVLQIDRVFTNVSKGMVANSKDLKSAFGTDDHDKICRMILDQGEVQVSDKERQSHVDSLYRDIATIVAQKTINPESNRPYTVGVIERAMKDAHFAPVTTKSAKQQALEVIRKLQDHMTIARAKMKLKITVPRSSSDALSSKCADITEQISADNIVLTCTIEPGLFRQINILMKDHPGAMLEVVDFTASGSMQGGSEEGSTHEVLPSAKGAWLENELENLNVSTTDGPDSTQSSTLNPSAESKSALKANKTGSKGLSCTTCGGSFDDRAAHREHFRSDWHRYNLKLKLKKLEVVDKETFEQTPTEDIEEVLSEIS